MNTPSTSSCPVKTPIFGSAHIAKRAYALGMVVAAALLVTVSSSGCRSASSHVGALHSTRDQELTVGVVQKEIRRGMSQSDVAQALGSPNIVTREDYGADTWVYDKIATEASYSADSGGIWVIIAGYDKNAGASATTQKTLTVVIKFDKGGRVDTFTYHSTKF
jgi:outer membrane protein assembly factor BamE (lipoprotein component of BamABCDE complex)